MRQAPGLAFPPSGLLSPGCVARAQPGTTGVTIPSWFTLDHSVRSGWTLNAGDVTTEGKGNGPSLP